MQRRSRHAPARLRTPHSCCRRSPPRLSHSLPASGRLRPPHHQQQQPQPRLAGKASTGAGGFGAKYSMAAPAARRSGSIGGVAGTGGRGRSGGISPAQRTQTNPPQLSASSHYKKGMPFKAQSSYVPASRQIPGGHDAAAARLVLGCARLPVSPIAARCAAAHATGLLERRRAVAHRAAGSAAADLAALRRQPRVCVVPGTPAVAAGSGVWSDGFGPADRCDVRQSPTTRGAGSPARSARRRMAPGAPCRQSLPQGHRLEFLTEGIWKSDFQLRLWVGGVQVSFTSPGSARAVVDAERLLDMWCSTREAVRMCGGNRRRIVC